MMRRKLGLERLDQRLLLAGDCDVALKNNGDLTIRCDQEDNGFVLSEGNDPSTGFQPSLAVTPTFGTTLNGQAFAGNGDVLYLGPVEEIRRLRISMKGGDDRVTLANLHMPIGEIDIDMGKGEFGQVFLGHVSDVTGDLSIGVKQGRALFDVSNTNVGGNATFQGKGADDSILLSNSSFGNLDVNTGNGDDFVRLQDLAVNDEVDVDLGGDRFRDHLSISGSLVAQTLRADGGAGDSDLASTFNATITAQIFASGFEVGDPLFL